jgi:adenylate cyclase
MAERARAVSEASKPASPAGSDSSLDLAALESAGLYDPADPKAAERLELIRHLVAIGASLDQMAEANATGNLRSVGADLLMFDLGNALTVAELADRIGIPLELALRIRIASGFPSEPGTIVPEWAIEDVAGFKLAVATFGESSLLAFCRVMGASAGRIAEAGLGLFLAEVEAGFDKPELTDLDRALAVEGASGLFGVISTIMSHLLREHLMAAVRRQRASLQNSPIASDTLIGFVDLVNSTGWAAGMSLRAQAEAISHFEAAAWEIATRRGGRVVKLIGDEVMFTAPTAEAACDIALDICEAVERETTLPRARGAVGMGDVYYRDGDYYGTLVHVVARAVKEAAPNCVVVTQAVAEACEGTARFAPLGRRQLRGIEGDVELFSLQSSEET